MTSDFIHPVLSSMKSIDLSSVMKSGQLHVLPNIQLHVGRAGDQTHCMHLGLPTNELMYIIEYLFYIHVHMYVRHMQQAYMYRPTL